MKQGMGTPLFFLAACSAATLTLAFAHRATMVRTISTYTSPKTMSRQLRPLVPASRQPLSRQLRSPALNKPAPTLLRVLPSVVESDNTRQTVVGVAVPAAVFAVMSGLVKLLAQRRTPSLGLAARAPERLHMAAIAPEAVGQMPVQVETSAEAPEAFAGPTLVYMVTEEVAATLSLPAAQKEEFTGKDGQVTMAYSLPSFAAARVLLVGVGAQAAVKARTLRCATATAVKELKGRKIAEAGLAFPEPALEGTGPAAGVVVTTALLNDYFYDCEITDKERCFHLKKLTLLTATPPAEVAEHVAIAQGSCITRDLLNTRADVATPAWMGAYAVRLGEQFPAIDVRVVEVEEMRAKQMNLITAVGGGAQVPPRIVFLHYRGAPDSDKCLALVGKGLCFDAGGLNLKPTGSIEQMHMDKGGACAVLGTMHAIASQKLKTNVVGVVAFAENAIGSKACKPHEIITSYKGLTVRNNNTDAEGRLVLADTMTYLQKEYKVDQMFTLATLTGAILISLGHYAAGMFTHSDSTAAALTAASLPGDERVWRMPLFQEYADQLKGQMCDLHSTGKDRWAGSSTAASFLFKFAEEGVEYTHLDIAGTAGDLMGADDRPWVGPGATGWGPNILFHYVKANRCG